MNNTSKNTWQNRKKKRISNDIKELNAKDKKASQMRTVNSIWFLSKIFILSLTLKADKVSISYPNEQLVPQERGLITKGYTSKSRTGKSRSIKSTGILGAVLWVEREQDREDKMELCQKELQLSFGKLKSTENSSVKTINSFHCFLLEITSNFTSNFSPEHFFLILF